MRIAALVVVVGSVSACAASRTSESAGVDSACRVLEETQLTVASSGVVGSALGPTIRVGVKSGYLLGPLVAVKSEIAQFELPWTVVAADVSDRAGKPLGQAVWLSPDDVATFNPGSGVAMEEWRQDPARFASATYVRSANRLAERISVFSASDVHASAEGAAETCAAVSA